MGAKIQKMAPDERSSVQRESANGFKDKLSINKYLFDIATNDALEAIKIKEEKESLQMHREKGHPDCMASIEKIWHFLMLKPAGIPSKQLDVTC